MKKARPKKVEITEKITVVDKLTCKANKKDKTQCSNKSKENEHYCGVHLKTVDKVAKELADSVLLSAVA